MFQANNIRSLSSFSGTLFLAICSLMAVLSFTFSEEQGTAVVEVNMRVSLEGIKDGSAIIHIESDQGIIEDLEGSTKEENLFFLELGAIYFITISAPGFASKRLEFNTTHPKAREGEFPCDIDLFRSEISFTSNPPVVGVIAWNNFKKYWVHQKGR